MTDGDPVGVGVARLRAALAGRDRWLLVFDNAENPEGLAPLLPDGPGQVLITSRNPVWRPVADTFPVAEFARVESVELLGVLAPELGEGDADRVAAAVGDLPLAVEQAGALLADTGMSVDTWLGLLGERAEELLGHDGAGTYAGSVSASWAVAFDRLGADDPTALELLSLLAWCGPQPVPLSLLTDAADVLPERLRAVGTDALVLARCTGILRRRGMATVAPHSVRLHRVPAALLRARTRDPAGGEEWAAVVVRLLRAVLPWDVWNNPAAWPRWQELLEHVMAATDPARSRGADAENVAWLLYAAANYRSARGDTLGALPLFRRGHAICRVQLGEDHLDTLTAANNLAVNLSGLGEYEEARALHEDTLIRRRRLLGDEHRETLASAKQSREHLVDAGRAREGPRPTRRHLDRPPAATG